MNAACIRVRLKLISFEVNSFLREKMLCQQMSKSLVLRSFRQFQSLTLFHKRTIISSALQKGDFVFRDLTFKSREIPTLPQNFRSCGLTMTIDYARRSEVTSSLCEMLKMANHRGDNVGIDEYEFMLENSERNLLSDILVEYSTIFTVRSVWLSDNDCISHYFKVNVLPDTLLQYCVN